MANQPTRPKPPLRVQIAAASWQSLLVGLVVLGAPGMFNVPEQQRPLATLGCAVLFGLMCVAGTGCSIAGFLAAVTDRPHRVRLLLHSSAGLVTPVAAILFFAAVSVAGSEGAVNGRAYASMRHSLGSAEVTHLPPAERWRAQEAIFREAIPASRGEQRRVLEEGAAAMARLADPFEQFMNARDRYADSLTNDADLLHRMEALDRQVEAGEAWRAALREEDLRFRRVSETNDRSAGRLRALLLGEFSIQDGLAGHSLEIASAERRRYDFASNPEKELPHGQARRRPLR